MHGRLFFKKKAQASGLRFSMSDYSTTTVQPKGSGMRPHWMPVRLS